MTNAAPHPLARRIVPAVRWAAALAGAIVVAFALPAGESPTGLAAQFAAYLVLAFLLVNALRHRMALRSACAMAVIAACLIITTSEAVGSIVLGDETPDTLVPGLVGAVVGAVAAFPVFKRVHHAELVRAAQRQGGSER